MENIALKILGWILLILGLGIIVYALYSSYNIFTNQTPVPQIFSSEIKTQEQSSGLLGNIQDQIQGIIGQQIQEIIPQNSIAKLLNLIVWSVFAGVAIMAGSQISGLGIKMIK